MHWKIKVKIISVNFEKKSFIIKPAIWKFGIIHEMEKNVSKWGKNTSSFIKKSVHLFGL